MVALVGWLLQRLHACILNWNFVVAEVIAKLTGNFTNSSRAPERNSFGENLLLDQGQPFSENELSCTVWDRRSVLGRRAGEILHVGPPLGHWQILFAYEGLVERLPFLVEILLGLLHWLALSFGDQRLLRSDRLEIPLRWKVEQHGVARLIPDSAAVVK